MSALEAFLLGMLQGLTEFLPVSSSGHIELGAHYLGIDSADNLLFTVLVHGATVLSTLIVFRKDIAQLLKGVLKWQYNEETRFVLYILVSMIPVGIVGVFYKDEVEALFTGKVLFVASMLMVTGFLLLATHYIKAQTQSGELNYLKAFIIGLAQALAVLPGISRSGATIATGLLTGVRKEQATRFAFLMVIIPILGASLLEVIKIIENPAVTGSIPVSSLVVGFISALVFGILACRWMINIVQKGNLKYFAFYCFAIATVVLIVEMF